MSKNKHKLNLNKRREFFIVLALKILDPDLFGRLNECPYFLTS
jgi:hypothetical protein